MTPLTNEELAEIESTREPKPAPTPTGLTRRDDLHNVIARIMMQPVYNSSAISDAVEQYLERLSPSPAPTPTPLTVHEQRQVTQARLNQIADSTPHVPATTDRRNLLAIIDRLTNTAQENER